ncbi:MAG: DUF4405 domain-containing protein [Pirellulaceae bacterium]
MKRTRLNLMVDLAAIVLLSGMIATGFILWFPLPPGTETTKSLWGLSRYSWGTLHAWISLGLLGVLFIHVVLHWKWLVSMIARRRGHEQPSAVRVAVIGVLTAVFLATVSALFAWLTFMNLRPLEVEQPQVEIPITEDAIDSDQKKDEALPNTQLFADEVWPIFQRRCLRCHGPERASGNFRVDREADFYREADRPLIVRGEAAASGLIDIVTGVRRLPRPGSHRLSEDSVESLRKWIDSGAARDP